MKTILTFLIAVLAFAGTVAWAGEPTTRTAAPAAAEQAAPRQAEPARAGARTPSPVHPQAPRRAPASRAEPAADFRIELPDAPAVFCACVSQRRMG